MWYLEVFLSLAAPLALGIRYRRYYAFFVVLLLFYSLLVPLNIPGQFDDIGQFSINFLIASNIAFSVGIAGFEYLNRGKVSEWQPPGSPEGVTLILFLTWAVLFFVFLSLSGGIFLNGVFDHRDSDPHSSFELPLPFFAILVFGTYGALRLKWQIILFPVLVLVFMNTGGRAALVGAFVFVAYMVFRRMKTTTIAVLTPIVLVGSAALYYVLRIVRSLGLGGITDMHRIAVEIHANQIEVHGGENVIARGYLFAVSLVQNGEWHPSAETIRRLIFLYVPRSWGFENIKAEDITYRLWSMAVDRDLFSGHPYNWYFKQSRAAGGTGSLHPMVWGEGFLNLGMWSLAVYPFATAWILTRWDSRSMRENPGIDLRILMGALAPTYLYLVRGSVSIAITYAAIVVPLLWLGCKATGVARAWWSGQDRVPAS